MQRLAVATELHSHCGSVSKINYLKSLIWVICSTALVTCPMGVLLQCVQLPFMLGGTRKVHIVTTVNFSSLFFPRIKVSFICHKSK